MLGAGQLGRMLQQEASTLGIELYFLDKSKDFPAGQISKNIIVGDFKNYDDVIAFGQDLDLITIEIENVNTDALLYLEKKGKIIYPQPEVVALIKDKGLQKQFYKDKKIPTSEFNLYDDAQDIKLAIKTQKLNYPFVQKSRLAGYDGKGVAVIRSEHDVEKLMSVPSVIEDLVNIDKELAIIIAKNKNGETKQFPLTEMVFNESGNLLDHLICPSTVSDEVLNKCQSIATQIISELDMIGILAIEFFLDKTGKVLVNEVAPRTHNSGHHTIDANINSQFNLHLRSILNLSLGNTDSIKPSVMLNLLGEPEHTGKPYYEGLKDVLTIDGVFPHIYGKKLVKPLRKMGHLTILADTLEDAISKLEKVKSTLKVKSCLTK